MTATTAMATVKRPPAHARDLRFIRRLPGVADSNLLPAQCASSSVSSSYRRVTLLIDEFRTALEVLTALDALLAGLVRQ
jgi:hypothetical protein